MKFLKKILFISYVLSLFIIYSCTKGSQKTNFVFFLVDDLGWTDLGAYGSTFYETPHIDKLAKESTRFTDAYAACPVCSPTRASIMTGKYPARMDTTDWFGAPQPQGEKIKNHWTKNKPLLPAKYIPYMPLEEKTIAEALQEKGYKTFFAGKWHLGKDETHWPKHQGFDINIGGWKTGAPYTGNKYFSPYENPRMKNGPDGEYLTDRLAQETASFIKKNKNKPFLAYLSFYSVHTPLMAPKERVEKYKAKAAALNYQRSKFGKEGKAITRIIQDHAVYAAMVESVDLAVGKVLQALKKSGLEDNTVIILMSDNGGLNVVDGNPEAVAVNVPKLTSKVPTSNLPLRGGKGWLYEGGIREPMLIKWPGKSKQGGTCSVPVTSTDFYPTILEMAGIKPNEKQHQDGLSLVPLFKGESGLKRKAIYWHYPHYGNQGGSPGAAIRLGDFKLIEFFEDNQIELYNLKEDLSEKNDLSKKMPEKANELRSMLKDWYKEVDAKFPSANPQAL